MLHCVTINKNPVQKNGALPSLFDDPFLSEFFKPSVITQVDSRWPAVDIHEYKNRFVLVADLPGVDEKDIQVKLEEGSLILEGERSIRSESEEECTALMQERAHSRFKRSFSLGEGIDRDRIEATFRNGVLSVTLPKLERIMPKVIPIQSHS
jgi:HSP20 family protein